MTVVEVDRSSELPGLLAIGAAALDSGRPDEAYEYANRALEVDHTSSDAWSLKGLACADLSGGGMIRISEATASLKRADEYAAVESRDQLRAQFGDAITASVLRTWQSSMAAVNQAPAEQREALWRDYVAHREELFAALQLAYEWSRSRQALDAILRLCEELNVPFSGGTPFYLKGDEAEAVRVTGRLAAAQIKENDEAFEEPRFLNPHFGCFVVTAVTGDEASLPVVTLREFRDTVLRDYAMGQRFIRWYGDNGPRYAKAVAPSRLRRTVAMVVIVAPSTGLAWLILRARALTDRRRVEGAPR